MKTKKSLRVLVLALAVVMVFGVMTTAFADGGFFYGAVNSEFTARQTFNKVNDKNLEDNNISARIGSYTGSYADYNSYLLVAGKTFASTNMNNGDVLIGNGPERGLAQVKVTNPGSATRYVRSEFYIYNGSTIRRITDWSNHW